MEKLNIDVNLENGKRSKFEKKIRRTVTGTQYLESLWTANERFLKKKYGSTGNRRAFRRKKAAAEAYPYLKIMSRIIPDLNPVRIFEQV